MKFENPLFDLTQLNCGIYKLKVTNPGSPHALQLLNAKT